MVIVNQLVVQVFVVVLIKFFRFAMVLLLAQMVDAVESGNIKFNFTKFFKDIFIVQKLYKILK